MLRHVAALGLFFAGLCLIAAQADDRAEELVRQGNTAYEDEKFTSAIELYSRAEAGTSDPGLVAYNKALAYYRLGIGTRKPGEKAEALRQAATYFRRAAENAETPRRGRARFGLGNSLLLTQPGDAAAMQEAVNCYRQCLAGDDLDDEARGHARKNLELARLKLVQAREAERNQNKENPRDDKPGGDGKKPPPPPRDADKDKEKDKGKDKSEPNLGPDKRPEKDKSAAAKDGNQAIPTREVQAGGNTGEVKREQKPSTKLSPEEADAKLKLAVQKIRDARKPQKDGQQIPNGPLKER